MQELDLTPIQDVLGKAINDLNGLCKDLVAVCLQCGVGSNADELLLNDGCCWNCDTKLN